MISVDVLIYGSTNVFVLFHLGEGEGGDVQSRTYVCNDYMFGGLFVLLYFIHCNVSVLGGGECLLFYWV